MEWFLLVLAGIIGGILGGMGMGGGTLLIPMLTLWLGVEQKLAQLINLIAFIPMAIVVVCMQAKKKNVQFKDALWIAIPALVTSGISAYCVKYVSAKSLSRYFGIFLIVVSVLELGVFIWKTISEKIKEKKSK